MTASGADDSGFRYDNCGFNWINMARALRRHGANALVISARRIYGYTVRMDLSDATEPSKA